MLIYLMLVSLAGADELLKYYYWYKLYSLIVILFVVIVIILMCDFYRILVINEYIIYIDI